MQMLKKSLKTCAVFLALLLCLSGMTVWASGYSDDNSLSDLGIENAVSISPEFEYSITQYDVVVEEGTEELRLNPVTSNSAATYEISGQALTDGKTTVQITVTAESGMQAVYTLNVEAKRPNAAEQIAAANADATEAPKEETQTEMPETQKQQETQTEKQTASDATGVVMEKVEKLKSDTDFSMKVIYGLIAFSVLLLFIVINLILKNRDLKDDLRDAQEKLEMQTNEFARKERFLATENYYAPVQQQAAMGMSGMESRQNVQASQTAPQQTEEAPNVEETFGAVEKQLIQQTQAAQQEQEVQKAVRQAQKQVMQQEQAPEVQTPQAAQPAEESMRSKTSRRNKKSVDVTMIDL